MPEVSTEELSKLAKEGLTFDRLITRKNLNYILRYDLRRPDLIKKK